MSRSTAKVWGFVLAANLLVAAPGVLGGPQDAPEASEKELSGHHGHGEPSSHAHGKTDHGKTNHGETHQGEASHEHAYQHGSIHHDFSNAEEWSARFDNPERLAWQKPAEVTELLAIEPGMTVVDIGAGTGYFLSHLSRAVGAQGKVQALDPEVEMVRFMEHRAATEGLANVAPRQIPLDDPELAAGQVDRILIVNTWHHIAQREAYSRKLAEALAPGGRVAIVDFTRDSPSGPPVADRLTAEQVIAELAAGGLRAEVIEESLPRQYVVVGQR